MRIPTSTIVMALVTCVPFALAIRDTASGKSGGAGHELDDEDAWGDGGDSAAAIEKYAAEMEAREAAQAAMEAARAGRTAKLRELIGAEPATLGPAFGELRIGMAEADLDGASIAGVHRFERTSGTKIALEVAGTLRQIAIGPDPTGMDVDVTELCETIEERATFSWGEPVDTREGRRYWFHPVSGTRAHLVTYPGCGLVFDRSVPLTGWLDAASPSAGKTSVIPIWAVGQPATRLLEALGGTAQDQGEVITWDAPGVGTALGGTSLVAYVEKGKVVTIDAAFDEGEVEAVTEYLTELHGEPTTDGIPSWKTTPPITLESIGGAPAHLRVGKQP